MKRLPLALLVVVACTLTVPVSAPAQMFTDFKPGGTVPKDGYTPDPKKVMYVIFWHHKKNTNEFDHRAYYMNDDGVNNTTADKMKKLIEDRYPNLTVYVKETNERDIKTVIEREQKRVKFVEKDWVDVKQPEKVELPKKVGDKKYEYVEDAPKTPADLKPESTVIGDWYASTNAAMVYRFDAVGTGNVVGSSKLKYTWSQTANTVKVTWVDDSNGGTWVIKEDRMVRTDKTGSHDLKRVIPGKNNVVDR